MAEVEVKSLTNIVVDGKPVTIRWSAPMGYAGGRLEHYLHAEVPNGEIGTALTLYVNNHYKGLYQTVSSTDQGRANGTHEVRIDMPQDTIYEAVGVQNPTKPKAEICECDCHGMAQSATTKSL